MTLCALAAVMLLMSSCRQSLRSQIELKCQEYTRKNCPMKVDNIGMITLDSVVFHDDEHSRYYYYYSVVADSTETKIMQDNRDIMYRSMLSGLINSPDLKNVREEKLNIVYHYSNSLTGEKIMDLVFTPRDYE